MTSANACDCPSPPGGRVECGLDEAAVCWVDESGQLVACCLRLGRVLALAAESRSEAHLRAQVTALLTSRLPIPRAALEQGEWALQHEPDAVNVSIRLHGAPSARPGPEVRMRIPSSRGP